MPSKCAVEEDVGISTDSDRLPGTNDGQPGSYSFVRRISTEKRACIDWSGHSPVVADGETARVPVISAASWKTPPVDLTFARR